jgi:4-diphosphocytidyl-2-C-methyl-D-erythritol kinase
MTPQQPETTLREILHLPVAEWKGKLRNDFEKTVFARYPAIAAVKEKLYEAGAVYASMSGSGATVYGIFEQERDVRRHFPAEYVVWPGL